MNRTQRAIGIDIGGTKIAVAAVAAVDGGGAIAARTSIATEAELGFERAVGRMAQAIDGVLAHAGWSAGELCGIGVGCAGPVSPQRGIIDNPHTLPTWVNCDIVTALGDRYQRPVYLENDADSAALGESYAGCGRGHRSVVLLALGTGVGGGAVIDGKVFRGTRGEHPELGHIPIDPAGPECYCGTRGCLESLASGTAMAAAGEAAGYRSAQEVFAAAARGEVAAGAIVERARDAMAMAAWTILHTFMPELIVLGGGIIDQHYELFAPPIAARIERATMVPKGGCRVAKAQLGNEAGLVGAASLALVNSGAS